MALFKIQRGLSKNFAQDVNPQEYDTQKTYKINDICIYNDNIYKCIVAIDIPESFDISHWNLLSNSPEFTDGYAYFTPDDGGFYIDATYNDPETLTDVNKRIQINTTKDVHFTGTAYAPTVKDVFGKIDLDDNSDNIVTNDWVRKLFNVLTIDWDDPIATDDNLLVQSINSVTRTGNNLSLE